MRMKSSTSREGIFTTIKKLVSYFYVLFSSLHICTIARGEVWTAVLIIIEYLQWGHIIRHALPLSFPSIHLVHIRQQLQNFKSTKFQINFETHVNLGGTVKKLDKNKKYFRWKTKIKKNQPPFLCLLRANARIELTVNNPKRFKAAKLLK